MEEAEALQRTAEWRLRKLDANPDDAASRNAAALLERLAAEVRCLDGSAVAREYGTICNWLGELGEIADFLDMAQDYRARIGIDRWPVDAEAYIRALINLAKQGFGAS